MLLMNIYALEVVVQRLPVLAGRASLSTKIFRFIFRYVDFLKNPRQ